MRNTVIGILGIVAVVTTAGCSQRNSSSSESSLNLMSPTGPSLAASTGNTVKETLTGPAIAGVVPEGQAVADQSHYLTGGSTILTVQVKKVNRADGTNLRVSLDGTPVGSLTITKNEGTMSADLGHFAVSRDQVRVLTDNFVTVLSGSFFQ